MAKNNRLSRDQKRRAKLKKEAERSRKHESLAYHGKKYQTPEYVPIIHRTEIGIYESFVMSGRTLTDDDVESSLERLIGQLRETPRPPTPETEDEATGDLTMWNIRRNWQILADREELPRKDDLIGVLRTLLNSLEVRRSMAMHSQGYLLFVEGFMKETGVRVQQVTPEQLSRYEVVDPPPRGLGHDRVDEDDEDDE